MSHRLELITTRGAHGPDPAPREVEKGGPFRRDLSMAEIIRRAGGAV
ncbi:hypothetical protein AB0C11_33725 [Streptomyces sp. NPDC039016]